MKFSRKTQVEIIFTDLDLDNELAETIYMNIFYRSYDKRFPLWKDTVHAAPESEVGFIARLCVVTAQVIKDEETTF